MGLGYMKKVLIVDDEEIMRVYAANALAGHYITECAASGEEALALYRDGQPDLILLDVRMPGMTGFELQNILQNEFNSTVPIIYMTGVPSSNYERKGFESGALDYIKKPFHPDVLLRRIENVMQRIERIEVLQAEVTTDALTGLLNKNYAYDQISTLCKSGQGVLLMIDLDNFKMINELYGHETGDRLLETFSDIIRKTIRVSDIAGRIGGDEFIAFCQNIKDEIVIGTKFDQMNSMILKAAREMLGEDMTIPIGVSIGAVRVPDEGKDFKVLFRKADKALYKVKQTGHHGYNIYVGENENPSGTDMNVSADNMAAHIKQELGEGPHTGPFVVDYETFRSLYRFLSREIINYNKSVSLMILKLARKNDIFAEMAFSELMDSYLELLRSTLRHSDIITQSGEDRFLLLLPETSARNAQNVILRLEDKWKEDILSHGFGLSYEIEDV